MDLENLRHVDAGHPERHQHLDDQLVPRRRGQVGRGAQPVGQLILACGRDPVALVLAVLAGAVGLDEPVTLKPLQGRVHLADVERPDLAGPGLELLAQLEAVLRALAEQRQQRVRDAHRVPRFSIILGIVLSRRALDATHSAPASGTMAG